MDWDEYRVLLACSRSESIRAAARTLGVSHSTVLRKLERLETRLNTRLYDRSLSSFQLTDSGEDVLVGVKEAEDSFQSVERVVTGRDETLEGMVVVSMPGDIGHYVLLPDIQRFKQQFPGIQLKIDMSYSVADLHKREADIAIRFTQSPHDDLVGRRLGSAYQAVYATPAYIDAFRPEQKKSKAQWIGWGTPARWLAKTPFPHLGVFGLFDSIKLQIDLVKSGVGIGYLPCFLAEKEPKLVRLSEPNYISDLWVLYHSDLRKTTRIRVVRDFFIEILQKHLPIGTGEV